MLGLSGPMYYLFLSHRYVVTYSQQDVKLYKAVKFLQSIFNLSHFAIKYRLDWEYLSDLTVIGLTCHVVARTVNNSTSGYTKLSNFPT
jgi:hypothetical protein